MKILYISDSLGSPVHPRGIYNFSLSLCEILRGIGAQLDLVVEIAPGFGLEGHFGAFSGVAPDAINSIRLAEVHRFLNFGASRVHWNIRNSRYQILRAMARPFHRLWVYLREVFPGKKDFVVQNKPNQIDFVPEKSKHLDLFTNLLVKRRFYASSMTRANFDMPAPRLNAAGYDLVILDAPHFIDIDGISSDRVVTVIHDLIPLRDPSTETHWRYLFMRKLEATLAMGGVLVFVSQFTRASFQASFPRHIASREFVFYPAIRHKLLEEADRAREADRPAALTGTQSVKDDLGSARKRRKHKVLPSGFDVTLPYFVTACADEPRKNIALIVNGFQRHLRGRANAVVLGQINPQRYGSIAESNVFFSGYVTDAEKMDYFRYARGVIFPSFSEGFGIPILEGAVMGQPVICSDIEVFHEVAGDHAYYFNPHDPAALARKVEEALADCDEAGRRAKALHNQVIARYSQDSVGEVVRSALGELGLVVHRKDPYLPNG